MSKPKGRAFGDKWVGRPPSKKDWPRDLLHAKPNVQLKKSNPYKDRHGEYTLIRWS